MHKSIRFFCTLTLFMLSTLTLQTQDTPVDTCPADYQIAAQTAAERCADLDVNSVCYGSGRVEAVTSGDVPGLSGLAARVNAADVRTVSTAAYDRDNGQYSIALIRPRADLPDDALTMVQFGAVTLANRSSASSDFIAIELVVAIRQGINLRATPDPESALIGTLAWGQTPRAIGRTEDGEWLWIVSEAGTGWVTSTFMNADADLDLLETIDPDADTAPILYGPLQDFDFVSIAMDDAPCESAADSGLLLQTPGEDATTSATLRANGLPIRFSGTLYLQAESGQMRVSVLEGEALLADTLALAVGEMARIGFNAEGIAAVLPEFPEDYGYTRARQTPIDLLPRPVDPPFSLGGLLTPFEPGTGFLTDMPADGPCTVAWIGDVNLRAGPGTNYAIRQGVGPNLSALASARAIGTGGDVWWRLAEAVWIYAPNTAFGGNCPDLPWVDPPPIQTIE